MKAISLIWILSMFLLGYNPEKPAAFSDTDSASEWCQGTDCCAEAYCCLPADDGSDMDQPEEEEGCGDDCRCDATAQFLAIYLPDDAGRTRSAMQARFGNYVNQYHFEYPNLLFQPPRLMQA